MSENSIGVATNFTAKVNLTGSLVGKDNIIPPSMLAAIIPADKVSHKVTFDYHQNGSVSDNTYHIFRIAPVNGTIKRFEAALETLPDSSNTVSIDLKVRRAGAWVSVLAAQIVFSSADTAFIPKAAVLSPSTGASFNDGELLMFIADVTGSVAAGLTLSGDIWETT